MPPLARRNLFHDKIRLAVTLTGITFAVVLVVVELGLFLGFSTTTSSLIDRSRADLWIASRNVPYIEQGSPFSERKLYQVRATPGAASAEKYIARFASWKRPDGGHESVQVVGFNVGELPQQAIGGRAGESGHVMGGPWNITAGTVADLNAPNAVLVDDLYWNKLGITSVGEVFGINGYPRRLRQAEIDEWLLWLPLRAQHGRVRQWIGYVNEVSAAGRKGESVVGAAEINCP